MKKVRSRYVCKECGRIDYKPGARCLSCGAFGSMEEENAAAPSKDGPKRFAAGPPAKPTPLMQADAGGESRMATGISELDRVLGGGAVPGSAALIGGDPGIGKSTLLMQAACKLAGPESPVLYVSGEESIAQLKRRADRIRASAENMYLLAETDVESILLHAEKLEPAALILDSIQTLSVSGVESSAGSVTQVRESASALLRYAKAHETTLFMAGHVTKEGSFAGPKTLEHMVDAALYFENEAEGEYRVVRAAKNRFGSTNEIGVFQMTGSGLVPIENPSELFLSMRGQQTEGSAAACVMNGARPIFLEMQALIVPRKGGSDYTPFRVAGGIDRDRLSLLMAILEKRGGLPIQNANVFMNATGGLRVEDRSADLAALIALASSWLEMPAPADAAFMGEAGLGGELRPVARADERLKEAARQGFQTVFAAKRMLRGIETPPGLEAVGVQTVKEALQRVFNASSKVSPRRAPSKR